MHIVYIYIYMSAIAGQTLFVILIIVFYKISISLLLFLCRVIHKKCNCKDDLEVFNCDDLKFKLNSL